MRSNALLLIGVATVCGMIASIGLSQLTGRPAVKIAPLSARQRIYVAQHDIAAGQPLSEDNLRLESWDVDSVPPEALLRLEDALGKVCRDSLKRGEPLQSNALTTLAERAPPAIAIMAAAPAAPVPAAAAQATPVPAAPIAPTPAPSPAKPSVLVPAIASAAKTVGGADPSTPAAAPPAVPSSDSPGETESLPSSAAQLADTKPGATAESSEATPQTPRRKLATPPSLSASGYITDEGWVMTIYKSGGVKVLRWRPTGEATSVSPRGAAVEQSARPISDPKKG